MYILCFEHNSGTSSGQTSIIEDTLFTLENSLGLDLSLVRVSQEKKMNMEIGRNYNIMINIFFCFDLYCYYCYCVTFVLICRVS